jgi:hypothetical protein
LASQKTSNEWHEKICHDPLDAPYIPSSVSFNPTLLLPTLQW